MLLNVSAPSCVSDSVWADMVNAEWTMSRTAAHLSLKSSRLIWSVAASGVGERLTDDCQRARRFPALAC